MKLFILSFIIYSIFHIIYNLLNLGFNTTLQVLISQKKERSKETQLFRAMIITIPLCTLGIILFLNLKTLLSLFYQDV